MSTTPPARRSVRRRAVAVLGSAALVAAMVDGIGYAASGSSLVFGKTTMNAEASAAKVQPVGKKTVRIKVGRQGREMPEEDLYKVKLPKGSYQLALNGLFSFDSSGGATYAYLGCVVVDKRLIGQLSDPEPDFRLYFIAESMDWNNTDGGDWDSIIDSSNVITLTKTRTLIYGCGASGDAPVEQLTPLQMHLTKLDGIDNRRGSDYTLPTPRGGGVTGLQKLLR